MLHALWELGHFGQIAGRGKEAAADIPRKEALDILERNFTGVPKPGIAANLFLDYADQTAGLLSGRGGPGERVYAFPHRTFQEYFAGCYLAKRTRDFKRAVKEKLRDGDYWQLASRLGLEEVLHNDGREYEALEAAYFLCPPAVPALETDWRGVVWAGHFAAAIGAEAIAKDHAGDGPGFLQRLRQRLTAILEQGLLPARERADAGFVLGQLGDPREGVCTFPIVFVELPGGTFRMGSDDGESDEKPPHDVEVSAFKISKYPITNAQFEKFMNEGGYQNEKWWSKEGWKYRQERNWKEPRWWRDENYNLPNQPVVGVSWFEAEAFCAWLTAKSKEQKEKGNQIFRLPTEAEWEFAARGKEGRKYPWGSHDEPTPEHANYGGMIDRSTAVGSYPTGATPNGIFDLAGNVWEWCLDFYDSNYYAECKKNGVVKNPLCEKEDWGRVVRGASWHNDSTALRGARRVRYVPIVWNDLNGFRVCVAGES
jgi:formylglycine-generating enzyme required for sulfatase activity